MASPSVARINLSQIHAFAQSYRQIALAPQRSAAAAAAVVASRNFLLAPSGLPARVREFQGNLGGASATLPSVRALTELFHSKTNDAVKAITPQAADAALADLRAAAELAVDTLSADLQNSRRQHGTFPIAQHEVNVLLDQCFLQRVVLRLLLDQHAALVADSNRDESVRAPIVDWMPVIPLIQDTVEQVKAFSVEKNGACPEIQVKFANQDAAINANSITFIGAPSHLNFMIIELLKNSIRAVLDRFGVLNVWRAPPIDILVAADHTHLVVRVSDQGGGMVTRHHHRERGDYFSSTAPLEAMNYTYSRQFGAPFTGLGVGLGITRQYCRGIYGGSLSIESMPRHGCDAFLRLERRGNVMF